MDRKIFFVILLILVALPFVDGFGFSPSHWKDNPLKMYPGEMKEAEFNLQNCPSLKDYCNEGDVNIVVVFEEGEEIAEIISGDKYLLPFGSFDKNIIVRVSIPESADVGESYNVKFSINSDSDVEESGNVQIGTRYFADFPVQVIEHPGKSPEVVEEIPEVAEESVESAWSFGLISSLVIMIVAVIALGYLVYLIKKDKDKSLEYSESIIQEQ